MKNKVCFFIVLSMIVESVLPSSELGEGQNRRLVLHEWGAFTVLQDESGSPIPGVNINEESLPGFVHELSPGLSPDTHKLGPLLNHRLYQGQPRRAKGIARFDPAVTMRLETPIIYFYLPDGAQELTRLDVEVSFQRGWISEWYPDAINSAPGFRPKRSQQPITSATTGRISWKGITVGETGVELPETEEHVWLTPRKVKSDPVTTENGQTEKYLFYRGVANLEAPLRVVRTDDENQLYIVPNQSLGDKIGDMEFPYLWLADIRGNGTTAFRVIKGMDFEKQNANRVRTTRGRFDEGEYSKENMLKLRASMRQAVVADGLFSTRRTHY